MTALPPAAEVFDSPEDLAAAMAGFGLTEAEAICMRLLNLV